MKCKQLNGDYSIGFIIHILSYFPFVVLGLYIVPPLKVKLLEFPDIFKSLNVLQKIAFEHFKINYITIYRQHIFIHSSLLSH